MPSFGRRSQDKLNSCHDDLQLVLNLAIQYVDFGVTEGKRTKAVQDLYYETGRSKLKFPQSKHNKIPSYAVDIVPYVRGFGYDYKDLKRFYNIVYFIKGIAFANGIELRLGADWDSDFYNSDQNFHDLPHIELYKKLINGKWIKY